MAKKTKGTTKAYAEDLLWFVDSSPSPFHAVRELVRRLETSGFTELDEREEYKLKSSARHYVIREDSSIIAFVVGEKPVTSGGFSIIGAHTDSPCLKLKPNPVVQKQNCLALGVEVYGGAITATWTDRDLAIAGRVMLDDGSAAIVRIERPLLRVPNLAIHLNREVNKEGMKLNPQTQLVPLWAIGTDKDKALDTLWTELLTAGQSQRMRGLAPSGAHKLVGKKKTVTDFDLCLYDTQKGALSGRDGEFIHTARLDNLASCHAGCEALLEASEKASPHTRVLVCYDHEEIGSVSAQGAAGPFLRQTLERIVAATTDDAQGIHRALAASFCVSADMAHAVHPNYADLHEPEHMPKLGLGPVVKYNHNQRYATSSRSASRLIKAAKEAGVTPQKFVTRSDLACGSTIGPITSAELGITTVDIGNPMLSMHSIRELAATADVEKMVRVLTRFLR